jgi:hypothetical protein
MPMATLMPLEVNRLTWFNPKLMINERPWQGSSSKYNSRCGPPTKFGRYGRTTSAHADKGSRFNHVGIANESTTWERVNLCLPLQQRRPKQDNGSKAVLYNGQLA